MSTLKTEEAPVNGNATTRKTGTLTPRANIFETKDGYVLEAELPGVNKEGLDVTVENNLLTLTGRRTAAPAPGDLVYRESRDLDYRRVFDLDPAIDSEKITAKIENGVVTLTLPKAESVKPRKITVD
ncbi:MAG TPA: Hsp20/alpha crystallin family protein [Chthoniobacteraceae bacterium]|nr:Hsp20/alpha crystallin family protein [Chthoniobacteraceae bacterium]